jgi:hypothetical protein
MSKYVRSITKDMVQFIDKLIIGLYLPFRKLNKAERKKYILEFFFFTGLVKLKKRRRGGDVTEIGDKFAEMVTRGRLDGTQNYELFVENSVGRDLRTDWINFVKAIVTLFSSEHKLFFEWLRAAIKAIRLGRKKLSSHGITGKSKDEAISFTLEVLMAIYVLQCRRHFVSQRKRKAKRREKRGWALTELNINRSPAINHLSVTANSSEVGPMAENPNTVGAVNNVVFFDRKRKSANLPAPQ